MKEQEILDNAPEGSTHSEKYLYLKFDTYWYVWESEWVRCGLNIQCYDNIRSLADIKRIVELERELYKGKAKIKNQKVELTNLNAALKEHKA
jgi:hypothetical protein